MLLEPTSFDDVRPFRGGPKIREVRALVSKAEGYGASDVHDTPETHWILGQPAADQSWDHETTHPPIANPMSRFPRYSGSRKSWGVANVPSVIVEIEDENGLVGIGLSTVDIGSPNNSTTDLKRQITQGLNAYDLSFFPNGELKFNSEGVLYLNGDTGISAGIEASLKSVIGTTGALPIFISVSGPGNNATYTIVRFVGVRIMAVNLRGGPMQRYVRVQPASYSTSFTTRGEVPINLDSLLSQPLLIE